MDKIRVRYSKSGKARYISHLDLMTTMQRGFLRAGVALKYSEGFNPHPHISVALPASVGVESDCELMDVAVNGGTIGLDVNRFMPEGIEIQKTYRAWRGFSDIKWVEVLCKIYFAEEPCPECCPMLEELFSSESLIISKRTKRGTAEIDIAPHIREAQVYCGTEDDTCVPVKLIISAQNPTVSTRDLLGIIESLQADKSNIIPIINNFEMKRIDVFDTNMVLFK